MKCRFIPSTLFHSFGAVGLPYIECDLAYKPEYGEKVSCWFSENDAFWDMLEAIPFDKLREAWKSDGLVSYVGSYKVSDVTMRFRTKKALLKYVQHHYSNGEWRVDWTIVDPNESALYVMITTEPEEK